MNQPRTEKQEMKDLAGWLNARVGKFGWIHVPNESSALSIVKSEIGDDAFFAILQDLRDQGVKKGFPDVIIFVTPPNHPQLKGVAIELKRRPKNENRKGPQPREDQEKWLGKLTGHGFGSQWFQGADDAIQFLEEECGY